MERRRGEDRSRQERFGLMSNGDGLSQRDLLLEVRADIKEVRNMLGQKADRASLADLQVQFQQLRVRMQDVELKAVLREGPEVSDVYLIRDRLNKVEDDLNTTAGQAIYRRFFYGVTLTMVGLAGALVSLVLAHV